MNEYCMDSMSYEIDNHADTICFGKNFRPIFFTSQVCTVSPFLDSYESKQDVPICSAVTVVDLEDGSTILFEARQGLYFSLEIDRSLLNPDQVRTFNIQVCNNPTDPNRDLGITLLEVFIPMTMKGSICGFKSRCPTNEELNSC